MGYSFKLPRVQNVSEYQFKYIFIVILHLLPPQAYTKHKGIHRYVTFLKTQLHTLYHTRVILLKAKNNFLKVVLVALTMVQTNIFQYTHLTTIKSHAMIV